jgi:hypothetical protein
MTHRILPPDEWPKLHGTELETVWPFLDPQTARVIVVEEHGDITGCWALFSQVHAEGLWIKPECRGQSAVGRHLLVAMKHHALQMGARSVATASLSQTVSELLAHIGAVELVGQHYSIPIGRIH